MSYYIYAADVWCEDCGHAIMDQIRAEGHAPANPDDETTYDSDDWPKVASEEDPADSPQHCGSGETCINAIVLKDGSKVGMFLENALTAEGEQDVIRRHWENISEITALWMEHYGLSPFRRMVRNRIENALGYKPDWDYAEQAVRRFKGRQFDDIKDELAQLEDEFDRAGGRGVELAEEIDQRRIALAERGNLGREKS